MRFLKESDIERTVTRFADRRGIEHIKLTPQSRRGYPDRMFFLRGGRPFFLELKAPGKVPDKLQMYQMKRLQRLGYDVAWTDDAKVAIAWLEDRLRGKATKKYKLRKKRRLLNEKTK